MSVDSVPNREAQEQVPEYRLTAPMNTPAYQKLLDEQDERAAQ